MTSPSQHQVDAEREFLVRLGAGMVVAGDSIDEVGHRLARVADRRGVEEMSVLVLPTALLVQTGHGATTHVEFNAFPNEQVRLDQIGELYSLLDRAEEPGLDADEGISETHRILAMPPLFGPIVRTIGMGVLAMGFSLSLQPTVPGLLAAFGLGILVGLLSLLRLPGLHAVLPVLSSFVVASLVFAFSEHFPTTNPVRTLIPPLVIFLPGAMLTSGMRDLSAGQTISGASRLVQGVVVLMLMAFGIIAAATLIGTPPANLVDRPVNRLGPWAPWIALLFVTLGAHLHRCAQRRALPWILLVLIVAYGGQSLGALVFSAELSSFFGALAMTTAVLFIERIPKAPPSIVTFLPGFWLLVPGAAGLIGVTEILGTNSSLGPEDFTDAFSSVIEIAIGVLLATAVFRAGAAGVQTAVKTLPPQLTDRRWFPGHGR